MSTPRRQVDVSSLNDTRSFGKDLCDTTVCVRNDSNTSLPPGHIPPGCPEAPLRAFLNRGLAFAFLLPGLPLMFFLGLLVRLTSPGPVIYRQTRVGKNGRPFELMKLRSMIQDAEKDGPKWAASGDRRVTPIGRFLRRFHLDELPQLFNVLKGEMALVGPRPERPEFVKELRQRIPEYMGRLRVLPGITGLAQLNLPPDTDLDSVRRKLVLDLEYIDKSSALLDVSIILCTSCRLAKFSEPFLLWLFRLNRSVEFDDAVFVHITDTRVTNERAGVSSPVARLTEPVRDQSVEYRSGGTKY